jgi:hypothetical protein
VPKAASHPDAGDDALAVDEPGHVVPPAVPIGPRLQLPLDELLAKKLARGLAWPARGQARPTPPCWASPEGNSS